MGAAGSKGGGNAIGVRQIVRKTNKEDIFTIVTYNILADSAISSTAFPYCPKPALKPKKRHAVLMSELAALAADVLCLQEVEPGYYQKLLEPDLHRLGYAGVYLKKSNAQPEGVATFYKTSTMRLLKQQAIALNDLAERMCEAEGMSAARSRLATDNVALSLLLQVAPERHSRTPCVTVTNTHLHWDRTQPDTQGLEAALLLQELQAFAEQVEVWKASVNKDDIQVTYVVAGDFNFAPKSPAYSLMSKGRLDEKPLKAMHKCPSVRGGRGSKATNKPLVDWFPAQFFHRWNTLKSAYPVVTGAEPEFTTYTDQFKGATDYIWYSSDGLNANSALQVPDAALIAPLKGCPNATYPSDHVPLAAGFRFKTHEPGRLPFSTEPPPSVEQALAAGTSGANGVDANDEPVVKLPEYDPKNYDRYGYERVRSGINEQADYLTDYWKYAAKTSNY